MQEAFFHVFLTSKHISRIKIRILCSLSFKSEPFNRIWGSDSSLDGADELNGLPAMYGIVLKFSCSAPYGSLPSYHIPFFLGDSNSESLPKKESLDIVPVGSRIFDIVPVGSRIFDIVPVGSPSHEKSVASLLVTIKFEPREPIPGLVDVSINANAETGQIIHGKLQGVLVGIKDTFLKATVPPEITEDEVSEYYLHLLMLFGRYVGPPPMQVGTFSLKGGEVFAAIHGTQSVKLLEVPSTLAILVERYLAPFVVGVIGRPLAEVVKNNGVIKDVFWLDVLLDLNDEDSLVANSDRGPLYPTYLSLTIK